MTNEKWLKYRKAMLKVEKTSELIQTVLKLQEVVSKKLTVWVKEETNAWKKTCRCFFFFNVCRLSNMARIVP